MTIFVNTSYDASVNPVYCCVHIETVDSRNVTTLHVHKYANANTFFSYDTMWYYMSYDPKQVDPNKRCCVYTTKNEADAKGALRVIKDKILCCGDRVAL